LESTTTTCPVISIKKFFKNVLEEEGQQDKKSTTTTRCQELNVLEGFFLFTNQPHLLVAVTLNIITNNMNKEAFKTTSSVPQEEDIMTLNKITTPGLVVPDHQVTPYDILCGKGKRLPCKNKFYTQLIKTHKAAYQSFTTNKEKKEFALDITSTFKNQEPMGRFLVAEEDGQIDSLKTWIVQDDAFALKKIQQALREKQRIRGKKDKEQKDDRSVEHHGIEPRLELVHQPLVHVSLMRESILSLSSQSIYQEDFLPEMSTQPQIVSNNEDEADERHHMPCEIPMYSIKERQYPLYSVKNEMEDDLGMPQEEFLPEMSTQPPMVRNVSNDITMDSVKGNLYTSSILTVDNQMKHDLGMYSFEQNGTLSSSIFSNLEDSVRMTSLRSDLLDSLRSLSLKSCTMSSDNNDAETKRNIYTSTKGKIQNRTRFWE
jgi:hypothetical protein